MSKTIIYLIRHSEQLRIKGIYKSNESEQIKNEKIILSIDGEKKAYELSLKRALSDIDEIYSSNYKNLTQKYQVFNHINLFSQKNLGFAYILGI